MKAIYLFMIALLAPLLLQASPGSFDLDGAVQLPVVSSLSQGQKALIDEAISLLRARQSLLKSGLQRNLSVLAERHEVTVPPQEQLNICAAIKSEEAVFHQIQEIWSLLYLNEYFRITGADSLELLMNQGVRTELSILAGKGNHASYASAVFAMSQSCSDKQNLDRAKLAFQVDNALDIMTRIQRYLEALK